MKCSRFFYIKSDIFSLKVSQWVRCFASTYAKVKISSSVSISLLQIKICSGIFDKSKVLLKPHGFSVILFANNIVQRTIKLRSNTIRRMANKTAECPYEHPANRWLIFFALFVVIHELCFKQLEDCDAYGIESVPDGFIIKSYPCIYSSCIMS